MSSDSTMCFGTTSSVWQQRTNVYPVVIDRCEGLYRRMGSSAILRGFGEGTFYSNNVDRSGCGFRSEVN